jgi:hypothetical protein
MEPTILSRYDNNSCFRDLDEDFFWKAKIIFFHFFSSDGFSIKISNFFRRLPD